MRRALIIGAGHNGLLCGIRLAEAGFDVTVLEYADHPGGAVTSGEDTLPGFVHDRCAGFFPLTAASPHFAGVGLERHGVSWITPDVVMAHPFADGSAIALHRDPGATGASLDAVVPGGGEAWRALCGRLLPLRRPMLHVALGPFPPVRAAAEVALRLGGHALELVRWSAGSAAGLGRERLGGDRAGAWLAGCASHSDLSPREVPSGALALGLNLLGHWVGWPLARGGAGAVTDALVSRLQEVGGSVRLGAQVEQVSCRQGRATGVRLAGGEELPTDAVVATVSARLLAAMLPEDALPHRLLRRLGRWRYGLGTFKLDLALAAPVPWSNPTARAAGVVHVGGELDSMIRAHAEAARGIAPASPNLVVGQHSIHDASRAPAGKHTLYAYTRLPAVPGVSDDELAERIERRIEEFAPGFRELVLARSVRSPQRLESENPSLVGGDLGGGTYALDQQLLLRPAPRLVRHRTPLRGLYAGSASNHPGGGVHGAPGANAARAVIEDFGTKG